MVMQSQAKRGPGMSRALDLTTGGGSAVAVASWYASTFDWLNHNSTALLTLCAIIGTTISFITFCISNYYKLSHWLAKRRRDRLERLFDLPRT